MKVGVHGHVILPHDLQPWQLLLEKLDINLRWLGVKDFPDLMMECIITWNVSSYILLLPDDGVVLHAEPFTCCVMPKLLNNEDFIDGLKDELLDLDLFQKNNDLYKFQQVTWHYTQRQNLFCILSVFQICGPSGSQDVSDIKLKMAHIGWFYRGGRLLLNVKPHKHC